MRITESGDTIGGTIEISFARVLDDAEDDPMTEGTGVVMMSTTRGSGNTSWWTPDTARRIARGLERAADRADEHNEKVKSRKASSTPD